jgi:exodeoxyribonuclease V beta subunit
MNAWHRFPRGALAGDFLHDQLEWLAGERFDLDRAPDLQQRLRERCKRQGWEANADDVVTWLRRVCSQTLPALDAPLAGLATLAPEMEFWYPLDSLSLPALDACCRRHLLPGKPRAALSDRTLRGMMMGFADLVFEHEGRYWVLDHKSNALGARDADYTAEALDDAMLAHRYDVQAALYLLALHRLLRARLGSAYEPSKQLGGALYLFLRGVAGPAAGCCTLQATPALLDDLDAVLPVPAASPDRGLA